MKFFSFAPKCRLDITAVCTNNVGSTVFCLPFYIYSVDMYTSLCALNCPLGTNKVYLEGAYKNGAYHKQIMNEIKGL